MISERLIFKGYIKIRYIVQFPRNPYKTAKLRNTNAAQKQYSVTNI